MSIGIAGPVRPWRHFATDAPAGCIGALLLLLLFLVTGHHW
jgi:hypothetical protein